MTKHTNLNLFEIPVQQYKGWEVHILENQWLKMYITPELGGRIIQTELDGYGFFFVNPALEGHVPDVDRLGPRKYGLRRKAGIRRIYGQALPIPYSTAALIL